MSVISEHSPLVRGLENYQSKPAPQPAVNDRQQSVEKPAAKKKGRRRAKKEQNAQQKKRWVAPWKLVSPAVVLKQTP